MSKTSKWDEICDTFCASANPVSYCSVMLFRRPLTILIHNKEVLPSPQKRVMNNEGLQQTTSSGYPGTTLHLIRSRMVA